MMNACHYPFVQTHRIYNTKSEPEGEVWTSDDYDMSMWFINCNKYTTLVSDTDNGKGYAHVGT